MVYFLISLRFVLKSPNMQGIHSPQFLSHFLHFLKLFYTFCHEKTEQFLVKFYKNSWRFELSLLNLMATVCCNKTLFFRSVLIFLLNEQLNSRFYWFFHHITGIPHPNVPKTKIDLGPFKYYVSTALEWVG